MPDESPSVPSINFPDDDEGAGGGPVIRVDAPGVPVVDEPPSQSPSQQPHTPSTHRPARKLLPHNSPLTCPSCLKPIVGRTVNAMGARWHPGCFLCEGCGEHLEHVSAAEGGGRVWCFVCWSEQFAPRCYHCQTPIVEERFITLDDPALGKRVYHEQHFFCAECGDPFLDPSLADGHPYCEECHVRLRMPKCKRCRKSIRDGMEAVEALGGKWCWECFVCASCERPFEDPSYFVRDEKPFCERCFSIMVRNEV
ncbi:hypothetical protein GLOTRDRAFT_80480 [Gloeophyllum trabeum ATCC 11539]|uniref:LIM zinc-binding domain-containing protein n=1 Tax=Gloeophyllum trabeum (strain ATCC 11539 / FP-39264 / Madison 617) TaxID=670483 RepID=S7PXB4_GLOTA|nr:uncharacterized protein GLOTRDRAFT_80480 [Gloeophyllum trabeum ATCC 11539]EPQ52241.1 hypothetical protein GLOTRDRAFT_80480 [Gloeophyllum trabeum ATCC 11539]